MFNTIHKYFLIFIIFVLTGYVSDAVAGKIYKRVDKDGNIYYTDKPENIKEAEEQAEAARERRNKAKLDKLNREFGYTGDNKFTQKKIDNIKLNYQQRKQALKVIENKMESSCGKEPEIRYWSGPGEDRDRYLAWEDCAKQFEKELNRKKKQLRAAERKYQLVK